LEVGDVEAFDLLRQMHEPERSLQSFEQRLRLGIFLFFLRERRRGVLLRQFEQALLFAAFGHEKIHRPAPPFGQNLGQNLHVFAGVGQCDLGRHRTTVGIELRQERAQRRVVRFESGATIGRG
jgi:hypothetical protein